MEIQEHVPFSELGTYKIGGKVRYFFHAKSKDDVQSAILFSEREHLPLFILGGGSNLLMRDEGFDGVVVRPDISGVERIGNDVFAGAGILMKDLLEFCIREELSGLECAGGLPGTLGGAIRGNAGAFKGEIKDVVISVSSIDVASKKEKKRDVKDCQFGYRMSVFKEQDGKEIILSAILSLSHGKREEIREKTEGKKTYRLERHPMEYPNIGSIFKNVPLATMPTDLRELVAAVVKQDPFPVVPTAFLISECGLRGVTEGGAMVSEKHPNFIVNKNNAHASDVRILIDRVKQEVKKKFRITLEEEVMSI